MTIDEVVKTMRRIGINNLALMGRVLGLNQPQFKHLQVTKGLLSENSIARFNYFTNSYSALSADKFTPEDRKTFAKYILNDLDHAAKVDKFRTSNLEIADKAMLYTLITQIMKNEDFFHNKIGLLSSFLETLSSSSYEYLIYFITFANKLNFLLDVDFVLDSKNKDLQQKMESLLFDAINGYFKVSAPDLEAKITQFKKEITQKQKLQQYHDNIKDILTEYYN